ncbi:MAG: hypothetical protein JSR34_06410 [Proteobacteria bacterium]|nr:hypothetical protein [Pseudomonadota bacterium]
MDDIVVKGVDGQGRSATLEVQAKRTVTFSASDAVFAQVVASACRAAATPGFREAHHELAVAVARSTTKIEQFVQVVLKWARDYQDAEAFFRRLNHGGSAHQQMRDFVAAFRHNMEVAGAAHDDDAVWRLLSRFQVLVFDFESPGSLCALWGRDRCAAALTAEDAGRSSELWNSLQQIALSVAASGGDMDGPALCNRLVAEQGYRLAGDLHLRTARERLSEASHHALVSIRSTVNGVRVDRTDKVEEAFRLLEQGRYLEIRGSGGAGKSAVLKEIAERVGQECRVIVLTPNRVPPGGWAALRAQLGCDASARELLTDIAGDGGGIAFIDGIDRFDDLGQRNTVADLLDEVARIPGFRVVATARADFDADARDWLPPQILQDMGEAPALVIDELSDGDMAQLRQASPALASLLRPGHPAEKLVRNLYRLDRLSRGTASQASVLSEAQMARQWWETGDGASSGRLHRQRVLQSLAVHLLTSSSPLDTSALPPDAVAALIASGTLTHITGVRAQPTHDVLGDWAIGCLLFEETDRISALPLSSPAPMRLARGVEIAARFHAEFGSDATGWRTLLELVSVPGAHGSWRRCVLLALVRTERSTEVLDRCFPDLASSDAQLLAEIVRAAIVVDSQPAAPFWAAAGVDTSKLTDDFTCARGPAWLNLIAWSLAKGEDLPTALIPQFVELYVRWCNALAGQDPCSPLLVKRLHGWLIAAEEASYPHDLNSKSTTAISVLSRSLSDRQLGSLRQAFLGCCRLCPDEAASYLRSIAGHRYRHVVFGELLSFVGTAPYAAPQALTDLFLRTFSEEDPDEDHRSHRGLFAPWDRHYLPASPARPPFLDLLKADKQQGLRLIRGVIDLAVRRRTGERVPGADQIEVPFPSRTRAFPWKQSFLMSRSDGSDVVRSALMALEAWGHWRIEQGESVETIIEDILGPDGSPAAYLLVAVDVLLSHWPQTRNSIWPFAASAKLLVLDRIRLAQEQEWLSSTWVNPEDAAGVTLADLRQRPSRRFSLESVLGRIALAGPASIRESMREALLSEVPRLDPPSEEGNGLTDPSLMAAHALNRLDATNYVPIDGDSEIQGFEYIPPLDEAARFAELERRSAPSFTQSVLVSRLTQVISEKSCPIQLLEKGIAWATRDQVEGEAPEDDVEREMIERSKLIAAALVMRDGSPETRVAYGAWAVQKLTAAALSEIAPAHPQQLRFNRLAIAAMGLLSAHRQNPQAFSPTPLLQLAAQRGTDIVSVLRAEMDAQRFLDADITRSLVRLAMSSAIYAVRQRDDDEDRIVDYRAHHEAQESDRRTLERVRRESAVEAEAAWLAGRGLEPSWPELPDPIEPQPRSGLRIDSIVLAEPATPARPRRFALDDSAASGVLTLATDLWRVSRPELLESLVRHAWPWTAAANGVNCRSHEEPGERAFEWNQAYFPAALASAIAADRADIAFVREFLEPLPEDRLLRAAEATLRALDQLWLGDHAISDTDAVALREAVTQRIQATWHWRRLTDGRSSGVTSDAAGAIAAVFMNGYLLGNLRCYVLPLGMIRAECCLPALILMATQVAGSPFVALAVLALLEVDPSYRRLPLLAQVITSWWNVQGPSAEFWIDHGVGKRACDWLDKIILDSATPDDVLSSTELTSIIDILVQCGFPAARAIEDRIAARRAPGR